MTQRERIEQFLTEQMWTATEWREDEDGLLAIVGRATVLEDDEQEGLFDGDMGELSVSVVGAPEYGNERIHVGLMTEYHDAPQEVRDLSIIERI